MRMLLMIICSDILDDILSLPAIQQAFSNQKKPPQFEGSKCRRKISSLLTTIKHKRNKTEGSTKTGWTYKDWNDVRYL